MYRICPPLSNGGSKSSEKHLFLLLAMPKRHVDHREEEEELESLRRDKLAPDLPVRNYMRQETV